MTDRGFWFGAGGAGLNVRRLMYQSLIWLSVTGDDTSSLCTPLDAEDLKSLANALVDGVRRNAELGRDFLGIQVLVYKEQTVELASAQPGDAFGQKVRLRRIGPVMRHAPRPLPTMRCDSN